MGDIALDLGRCKMLVPVAMGKRAKSAETYLVVLVKQPPARGRSSPIAGLPIRGQRPAARTAARQGTNPSRRRASLAELSARVERRASPPGQPTVTGEAPAAPPLAPANNKPRPFGDRGVM